MIGTVIALIGLAFLFLYFAFNLQEEHFMLKILLLFFFIASILVIPTTIINDNCDLVIDSYTITGNTTTNVYKTECIQNESSSGLNLIRITTWFFRIFVTYFFIYMSWHWLKKSEKIVGMIK